VAIPDFYDLMEREKGTRRRRITIRMMEFNAERCQKRGLDISPLFFLFQIIKKLPDKYPSF
jgi:hypothetical protein